MLKFRNCYPRDRNVTNLGKNTIAVVTLVLDEVTHADNPREGGGERGGGGQQRDTRATVLSSILNPR